jgi:CheY-like chemotaxis protein
VTRGAGKTLLVVEDDPDIREALAHLLGDLGFVVHQASNGSEALGKLRAMRRLPEALVLDLMMPVMTGWEFREAQLADTRLRSIPVIVISASGAVSSLPADAFLEKPFELGEFAQVVQTVVRPREDDAVN